MATVRKIQVNLPETWDKLRYHEQQYEAYHSKKRFINLACGRRSGKTVLARRKIVKALAEKKKWKKPIYFYALPTYKQAKKVAWRELLDLIPKHWVDPKSGGVTNVMDLYIRTIFGSELYVVGMDKPQGIEGLGYDGGVVDEACDHKPESFDLSIRPALSDKQGWCWRIGVPKRSGSCSQEYKEVFDKGLDPEHPDMRSYAWPASDILPPEEIQAAKRELNKKDFNEQYNASWEQAGGLIFYEYKDSVHKRDDLCVYRPNLPLHIGMDFNVDPMCWVVSQIVENHPLCLGQKTLLVLDEVVIKNTNTPEALKVLYEKFRHHRERVYFYPDASSKSKVTSASTSDYYHLIKFETDKDTWGEKKVICRKKNPALADRFSVCNSVLLNAEDQVRFYVHSKCKRLIGDLTYRAYKEGTAEPNDSGDMGHCSDGLGYLVHAEFPMRVGGGGSHRIAIQSF